MERVFSAARDVPDMPPRSFVALLVLVALVATPAAGLGLATQGGAPAGDGLAQQATATPTAGTPTETPPAGTGTPPAGTGTPPAGTDTPPGGATGTPGGTATATPANRGALPPSAETWRLRLDADGDARWQVSVTVPIRNAEDAAAFEDVASEFGTAENPLEYGFFRRAAAEVSAETGREMTVEDVSRSTNRVNGTGTLSVSFTWTNFARTEGDRLVVGDGFNTSHGTWLPSLHDQLTLVVVPPSGYGVTSAPEVGIVDGAARWEGPYDLTEREPWIVYSGSAPTSTPAGPSVTNSPDTRTGGTDTPGGSPFDSLLPVVALAILAGASAAVLVVYMRSEDAGPGAVGGSTGGDGSGGGPAPGSADGTDAAAGGDTGSATGGPDGNVATGSGGDATAGNVGSTAGGATAGAGAAATGAVDAGGADGDDSDNAGQAADDGIDEELLSDEERVERLLERNGGRMKQATIVKETGWSNAKVSQLLSAMAEDDRVDKLRIGRENLISFPDEDVTDIDSSSE
jgi:hypothetical protein